MKFKSKSVEWYIAKMRDLHQTSPVSYDKAIEDYAREQKNRADDIYWGIRITIVHAYGKPHKLL